MANNFFNKIARNVSADLTLPTSVYNVPASTKTIVIELDVANRSTSSQTISVEIEDFSQKGTSKASTVVSGLTNNTVTTATHGFAVGDRVQLTNTNGTTAITEGGSAISLATRDGITNASPIYFVKTVPSTTSFTLAASPGGTTLTIAGNSAAADLWFLIYSVYVVRDAPVPIGGALKVIAGQKLVIEASDKLYVSASSASSVDAIASILQDVS